MRGERGFTMVEMVLVSSLFLVVLTATLSVGASFERSAASDRARNEHLDGARRGVDRIARQLRNLARRIDAPVILRASRDDFVFQTSDPERTWVRHCLQDIGGGVSRLWAMTSVSAPTAAMTGPCPGTTWPRADIVTEVTTPSTASGPLFEYRCVQGAPSTCPATSADYGRISSVAVEVLVKAARVSTAVHLRNQNEPPVASVGWRPLGSRQIILNASASYDPEGRTLRYLWFRAPAPQFTCNQSPPAGQVLWQGVTMSHTFELLEGLVGATKQFELVICDPGDLQARATAVVTIP